MSLLDRAIHFANSAYDYVFGTENANAAAKANPSSTKTVNSAVNPEGKTVGTVGDVVVKGNREPSETKPKNKQERSSKVSPRIKHCMEAELQKVKDKIREKCEKFNIDYEKVQYTILANMEFSYEEFMNLTLEEQLSTLYCIDSALGLYIVNQNKCKLNKSADRAAIIGMTAKNIKVAKEEGGIESIEKFASETGNIIKELEGKVDESSSDEEYIQVLENSRKSYAHAMQLKRLSEIRACAGDKEKIKEINRAYDARLKSFESQRQVDFIAAKGYKKAHVSVYLRSAKHMGDAYKTAIQACGDEYKTQVANSFTHDFDIELKKRYYEAGDPISSEQYQKAIEYSLKYMSEDSITKFQADAQEFKQKVEKGEVDAPYMTKEDFQAEADGINNGVSVNVNIKSAENFDTDKKISEAGEVLQGSAYITPNVYENFVYAEENKNYAKAEQNEGKTIDAPKAVSTPADIAKLIKLGDLSMTGAISDYHEKALDAIFEDKDLFYNNRAIAAMHVNNNRKNLQKLLELSTFSGAVELISQNISPTIKADYSEKVNLSAITRRAIFGKEMNNAVA